MPKENILQDQFAKKSAAYAAAAFVKNGMIVGLGTGSTATLFIERLIELYREGLNISVVATSSRTEALARKGELPVVDINGLISIDLTIDGADEVDENKCMIKGGGGALLREKIIASMSKELIIIVDETKLVDRLGKKFPLPVEIVPFAHTATMCRIEKLGCSGKLRTDASGEIFKTDNGNYIYDIHFKELIEDPKQLELRLKEIVGVIESGLFVHLANRIVIGYNNGNVKIRS